MWDVAVVLDELDRRLVAALHLAPRASFDELASVLGADASTISRRYTRLTDERLVRVVGQVDWAMFSAVMPVHLFIDTAGSAPREVIAALRAFPQMQYLAQTSGTSSVFATVHAATEDETAAVLDQVYATCGVAAVQTLPVLGVHGRGAGWDPQLLSTGERRRTLQLGNGTSQETRPATHDVEQLDAAERELVGLLLKDGRASAAGLGRAVGMPTSTAHRVVRRLLDEGWVRPRVEVEPQRLGFVTPFVLRLQVQRGTAPQVLAALTAMPQTRYTTRVAGPSALVCTGLVTDRTALAAFVDTELASVDTITDLELDVVLAEQRRYWMDRDDGKLGRFAPPPLR